MIEELKSILSVLKHSSSNEIFPLYSSYVQSIDGYLKTCNDDSFSKFKFDLPFEGSVNIFILENMIKNLGENTTFETEGNYLVIKNDSFVSKLPIANIDVPERPLPEGTQSLPITQDLLDTLNVASKFTLAQSTSVADAYLYKYILIDSDAIIATDTSRSFFKESSFDISTPIILNTKILNSLTEKSVEIGSFNNLTYVKYLDGYSIFTRHIVDDYPIARIKTFCRQWNQDLVPLCHFNGLFEAMKQITPILLNEKLTNILMRNLDCKLKVYSESKINGLAEVTLNSEVDRPFDLSMELKQFRGITGDSFKVFVKMTGDVRILVLKSDDGNQLVLAGYPI